MTMRSIIFLLFFICLASPDILAAGGGGKEKVVEDKDIVQVTGRVRLVGSDVMSELVISAEDRQWYIAREDKQKLMKLQQQTVTVEGKVTVKEMKWANGTSAGMRYTLSNIKIISINK